MNKKWQDISRIFLYLPTLSAGVIIASLWRWVFHFNGLANWLIGLFGLNPVDWFGGFFTAIPTVSFIVIFSSFGSNVILFLSSIQGVSKEYLEAATIDGANWGQIKRFVILPIIRPTILMVGMLTAIAALMIYETIFLLAPYEYSATITYQIYRQGFQFGKYGLASAQAIILLFVSVGLFMIKKRFEK
jgi:multiple sugar transport system permease protein